MLLLHKILLTFLAVSMIEGCPPQQPKKRTPMDFAYSYVNEVERILTVTNESMKKIKSLSFDPDFISKNVYYGQHKIELVGILQIRIREIMSEFCLDTPLMKSLRTLMYIESDLISAQLRYNDKYVDQLLCLNSMLKETVVKCLHFSAT